MSALRSVSACFPCYNDAATIADVVSAAYATLERLGVEHEVVVVNDGSADGSAGVLTALRERFPGLRVHTHEQNRGYGGALLSGFAQARKQWVFYTDGDGQFDPSELEALARAASQDVDVVQGYKVARADGLVRRLVGRAYHRSVALLFGLKLRDVNCDFRLIRRSVLQRAAPKQTSGAICVELVRRLQDVGAVFVEVPVHHYPRVAGRSQFFRPRHIAVTLYDLAALRLRLLRGPRRWAPADRALVPDSENEG